jgi:hypothetical protein
LEQFEAQIFSIIRQNLHMEGRDPKVILKNYKLIYYFLTVPICKDPVTVGKIISMLVTDKMQSMQIFSQTGEEMLNYEKIITELHFKKLILLARLIITCYNREKDTPFKPVKTNPKKLKSYSYHNSQSTALPSKFQKDDRERLIEQLSGSNPASVLRNILQGL